MSQENLLLAQAVGSALLVVLTAVYATLTWLTVRETRKLAAATEDMARATRGMAEAQVCAEVALDHRAESPALHAKLCVINHGPGPARDVYVLTASGAVIKSLPVLEPRKQSGCTNPKDQNQLELRWKDYLGNESVARYVRVESSDRWTLAEHPDA